jgi:hypothetical protein
VKCIETPQWIGGTAGTGECRYTRLECDSPTLDPRAAAHEVMNRCTEQVSASRRYVYSDQCYAGSDANFESFGPGRLIVTCALTILRVEFAL